MPVNASVIIPLLDRSPVAEVVFGIQTTTPSGLDKSEVLKVISEYPDLGMKVDALGDRFEPAMEKDGSYSIAWEGVKLVAPDGKRLGHFMRSGMFANFLPRYKGYEASFPKFHELWGVYLAAFRPELITGTSIRYVNVFELPLTAEGFEVAKWFRMISIFPYPSPFNLLSFHNQCLVSEAENGLQARIMLTSLEEKQGSLRLSLDIEGFRPRIASIDSEQPWADFLKLRDWTYRIFTEILKPECLEQFK